MFGGAIVAASALWTLGVYAASPKMKWINNSEWKAANMKLRQELKMDPVGMGGRKQWDPSYIPQK